MDKPFCKICDTKHWPSEDHKFAKGDPAGETLPERPTIDTSPVRADTAVRTDAAQAAREQHGVAAGGPAAPQPGEVCPTCGKRVGRSGAERMRQHRATARD